MTHGIHLDYRKTFLGNQCSTFGSPRNPSQGIHDGFAHETRRETESFPRAVGIGTSFVRDDEQNKGRIPMPTFVGRPSTMSSSILVEIPQNPMVGQQRLLNEARPDVAKQELHVTSLNKCISELQRQTEEQRLALQDAQYRFVESRLERVRQQEELSMKEKPFEKLRYEMYTRWEK